MLNQAVSRITDNSGASSLKSAEATLSAMLKTTNCAAFDCMLELNAKTIANAAAIHDGNIDYGGDWTPVVDKVSVTVAPIDAFTSHQYNTKVPVIIGSNRDEMSVFLSGLTPSDLTEPELHEMLIADGLNTSAVERVLALYSPDVYEYPANRGNFSLPYWMNVRIETDHVPGLGPCSVRWVAQLLANAGSDVYTYMFAHPNGLMSKVFVGHGAEITYVFGVRPPLDVEGGVLATQVSAYWRQFAYHGNPNQNAGLPLWPKYASADDSVMVLDVKSSGGLRPVHHLRKPACDWQSSPAPPRPAPSPPPSGTKWECHAGFSANSSHLSGVINIDMTYGFTSIDDCTGTCNSIQQCGVINWHDNDLHCHIVTGNVTHDEFISSLQPSSLPYTACIRVPGE